MEGSVAFLILRLLGKRTQPQLAGTPYTLQYGTAFRYFAIGLTVVLPCLTVLGTLIDPQLREAETFWYVFKLAWLFGGVPGLLLCNEAYRTRITIDADLIQAHSAWTGRKSIPWNEIDTITFTTGSEWFVIHSSKSRKIRVYILLDGISRFIDDFKRKMEYTKWEQAESGINLVNTLFASRD